MQCYVLPVGTRDVTSWPCLGSGGGGGGPSYPLGIIHAVLSGVPPVNPSIGLNHSKGVGISDGAGPGRCNPLDEVIRK